jgi:hypothetical protein
MIIVDNNNFSYVIGSPDKTRLQDARVGAETGEPMLQEPPELGLSARERLHLSVAAFPTLAQPPTPVMGGNLATRWPHVTNGIRIGPRFLGRNYRPLGEYQCMNRPTSKRILVLCVLLLGLATLCVPTWHVWRQAKLNGDLIAAIARNQASSVVRMLQQGADPNAHSRPVVNSSWWQALLACLHGRRPVGEGDTALIVAMHVIPEANPAVLQALIAAGAKVNVHTANGSTPLYWAVSNGNLSLVKLCLAHGANPNDGNTSYNKTLIEAIRGIGQDGTIARLLLAYGTNPNGRDTDCQGVDGMFRGDWDFRGETALIIAVSDFGFPGEDLRLIEALLAAGADVNATDDAGRTALMWAIDASSSHDVIVPLLLRYGASVSCKDKSGVTAVEIAYARQRSYNAAHGKANDGVGMTPHIPYRSDYAADDATQLIRLLRQAGAKLGPDPTLLQRAAKGPTTANTPLLMKLEERAARVQGGECLAAGGLPLPSTVTRAIMR